jgi:hypothetical protein
MFKSRLVVAGAVVLCLGLASAPWAGRAADEPKAETPRPSAPAEADFTGKVLALSTDYADKAGAVLEKVKVRTVGGRSFLVGKGVDDGREGNPYTGRTVWIAVDHVVQILEFGSVEELKKASMPGQER